MKLILYISVGFWVVAVYGVIYFLKHKDDSFDSTDIGIITLVAGFMIVLWPIICIYWILRGIVETYLLAFTKGNE